MLLGDFTRRPSSRVGSSRNGHVHSGTPRDQESWHRPQPTAGDSCSSCRLKMLVWPHLLLGAALSRLTSTGGSVLFEYAWTSTTPLAEGEQQQAAPKKKPSLFKTWSIEVFSSLILLPLQNSTNHICRCFQPTVGIMVFVTILQRLKSMPQRQIATFRKCGA